MAEKLTKAQRRLLSEMAEYPFGWVACETAHERRTANALKRAGLVEIEEAGSWFDCRITPAGRAALRPTDGEGQ